MGLGVVEPNKILSPAATQIAGPNANSNIAAGSLPNLDPKTLADLNAAQNTEVPADSKVVTFDLDETLISCNKLTSGKKNLGKDLGYELLTSREGREFFLRPGAEELFKWIKDQGFKIVVSSRNLHGYEDDLINSSPLSQYVDYTTGLEDLKKSYDAADKTKYPNHPYNKIGFFTKSFRFAHTFLKGVFVDIIYRSFKHYILRDKNIKPYWPIARWKLDKYPPQLSGSRILFDNLYEENVNNAKASKDWVACDPGEFYGDKEEPRNDNGDYVWVSNIKEKLRIMKDKGWQELYEREYNEKPENTTVELAPEAKSNPKLF